MWYRATKFDQCCLIFWTALGKYPRHLEDIHSRSVLQLFSPLLCIYVAVSLTFLMTLQIAPRPAQAAGNTVTIHITGSAHPPGFRPALVTIHVGDALVFLNDAQPTATYTIHASDQSFVSSTIAPGQQWRIVFSKPGTLEYSAQSMVGLIIVAPISVKLLPTPLPGAVATEIASIRSMRSQASGSPPSAFGLSSFGIAIIGVLLFVLAGLAGSILLLLRRRRLI